MSLSIRDRPGRHSLLTEDLKQEIRDVNEETKGLLTIRELANRLQITKSSLHNYLIEMQANRLPTWVKPKLSFDQQLARLQFVLNLRDGESTRFKDLKNVIMVDESWFYLHKTKGYVRLFPGDEMPDPVKVQHKSHIPKVMFLSAVARPNAAHNFDGKLLLIRVSEMRVAKRKSRYHENGDVYLHDCTMNAQIYRNYMLQIFAAIKERMPWLRGQEVIVQQDGASPHTGKGNLEFFEAEGVKDGWNIKVVTQPAQSPDLNVNDLGFFRSLKCRVEHLKNGANNMEVLFDSIVEAWEQYDEATLERIWGHQFECYRQIIKDAGDNAYLAPHSGVRNRVEPVDLNLNMEEFQRAKSFVEEVLGG